MKINDTLKVKIEKLVFGLEGLARVSSKDNDNFVIFVKGALVDEIVEIKITAVLKSYAKAEIINIIEPSKYRTKPVCPYYNACGSCSGQYMDYDYLVFQKAEILKDIFKNIYDKEIKVQKSPQIYEYRHKVQFPTQRTKNSKRLLIGYYRQNSHDLTNIKFCKMQPKIIDDILNYTRENLPVEISCYNEKKHKGILKNILFRITAGGILMTFVLNDTKIHPLLNKFSNDLTENFKEIKGIFANLNPQKSNKILSNESHKILGQEYIIEKLGNKKYKLGPTSFFQVNPSAAELLFDEVKNNAKDAETILDAFGGVGAIGIWLADILNSGCKITLLEENLEATAYAKENFELNNIKNYEILEGDANLNFDNLEKENRCFDCAIVDPPRKGVEKEGLIKLSKITNKIIYVSCNPTTLKRDAQILKELGFNLKSLEGFDLFPYTHHIECVSLFEKA